MKSIKPGRGPSMMGGVGSVVAIVFGIFWTILAASMTSGAGMVGMIFPLFGLCFIAMGVINAVYHFKNATSENRYSEFDITDEGEEPDPLEPKKRPSQPSQASEAGYCPYCGTPLGEGFAFCKRCGREVPK